MNENVLLTEEEILKSMENSSATETLYVYKSISKAQYQKIIDEIEKHIYHQRDTIMIGGFAVYHERTVEDILRYLKGEK